jgi:shikimate dehydrogenase
VAKHLGAATIYTVGRQTGEGDLTYSQAATHTDTDILINTTPCGMFGNAKGMAINPAVFPNLSGVVDVVYNPLRTPLVLAARKRGIPAVAGLYMLVMQAVLASEFFLDTKYDPAITEKVYKKIKKEKENIVLTGMPGCGKSTVGKLLAEKLNRPFFDIDEEITKVAGATPAAIIAEKGEAAFRDIEAAVICDISTKNGAVIATGGGAVLREENVDNLRSNGKLFFLNRSLDLLIPTADRPLSADREALEKRFAERYDTYVANADMAVDGNGTADSVATLVERGFFE